MNNKELVKIYSRLVWENRDLSAIERYVDANAVIHSPMNRVAGSRTMRAVLEKWLEAFPDLTVEWEDFIAEGDKVVSRWRAKGTHLGGFFNTRPTHEEIEYSGVTTYRLMNGKIVEYWALVDIHAILSQLNDCESMAEALE